MKYKNVGWVNLHRHSEFSTFDGMGRQKDCAKYAKQLGQTSLGISEHGSISGLIRHYKSCKEQEIKPILGCEIYFQPTFNKEKKYFHMCLFCKDLKGYQNLMRIITEANADNFYRVAIVTFDLLKKHHEGLICSTACIGGYPSKALLDDKIDVAEKRLQSLAKIFKDDFYVEIMPYKVMQDGIDLQEKVDKQLLKLIKKHNYKGIITTDSHYIRKEDYDTFKLMFKIAGKDKFDNDYSHRYMPTEEEVAKRFEKRYGYYPLEFLQNTKEIDDKCNVDFRFEECIPRADFGEDSKVLLKRLVKQGLKDLGIYDKEHIEQCKKEFDVIFHLGFEDYFLICWDIIKYALDNDIGYGKGRGSACGSLIAHALNITGVDPLELGTIFERFLRKDKKKMPDIDMDFCSKRRHEIFEYIKTKFKGRATQIAVYGFYKINNLVNDIGKALEMDKENIEMAKQILLEMYPDYTSYDEVEYESIIADAKMKLYEKQYNFVTHFTKLCGQIRYIGKHAGGVAITDKKITMQFAEIKAGGDYQACYDLVDLEYLKVLKMDILGLNTVTIIKDIEVATKCRYSSKMYKDSDVLEQFNQGNTIGIFQFEKATARGILAKIEADNIQDIIASTALNRPAPLKMKMPEQFADSKQGLSKKSLLSKYLPDTYGCFVYQEDIIKVCLGLAKLEWSQIDKVMKGIKNHSVLMSIQEEISGIKKAFVNTAIEKYSYLKSKKKELQKIFDEMTGGYTFNKGHAAGYTLLSIQMMYYKVYYPIEFWTALLKHEADERKRVIYESEAVRQGILIIPEHINGTSKYEIVEFAGNDCISRGLSSIKGIGPKAAQNIELRSPFLDRPDFDDRTDKRIVNIKVKKILQDCDAFEFNNNKILSRIREVNKRLKTKEIRM